MSDEWLFLLTGLILGVTWTAVVFGILTWNDKRKRNR